MAATAGRIVQAAPPTRARGRPAVGLEAGGSPGAPGCPACGRPLFAWIEIGDPAAKRGAIDGPTRVIDRCESCGLAIARDALPLGDDAAAEALLGEAVSTGGGALVLRLPNAASVQASLGAESWAGLELRGPALQPTPRAAKLLLSRRGFRVRVVRRLVGLSMASMWQTVLNLMTFNRDFAREASTGRLRARGGRGGAAFTIDAVVTVLAAVPVAMLAVLIEGAALLAGRGGYVELVAQRDR